MSFQEPPSRALEHLSRTPGPGLYRPEPEEPVPVRLAPVLLSLALLSSFLRLLDVAVLVLRPRLLWAYFGLLRAQWRQTPYAARAFADRHDARTHQKSQTEITYGETPVVTALYLLWRARCGRQSSLLDLGAGRGRVLLAARCLGASCGGIELLQSHVAQVQRTLKHVGANLENGDAVSARLDGATHIFLAWTCFSERTRTQLAANLSTLNDGVRVIALNWGIDVPGFRLVCAGRALCSWGVTPYFVLERDRSFDKG